MGYVLFFIESLATTWLFVALALACIGRLGNGTLRWALTVFAVLVPFAGYSVINVIDGFLEIGKRIHAGWFWPLTALTLTFLAGAVELVRRSRVRQPGGLQPAAATWPRTKLAIAFAVAAALHVMTFANLDTAVKQSLATLRAEATALATSVAPQRLPDGDNAALIYGQAFEAIGGGLGDGPVREWPQVWQDASDALELDKEAKFDFKSPELGQFLNERAGLILLLKTAAARPGCYFDRDFGRPTADMLLPELQDMRYAARLLAIHARWSASQGDSTAALDDANAIYAMARHAAMEPLLVSMLVAAAIDQLASETLEVALNAKVPTAESLTGISVQGTVSFSRLLARTLRMEEAFILNLFAGLDGMDSATLGMILQIQNQRNPLNGIGPIYRVFLLADDLSGYQSLMHEAEQSLAGSSYARTKSRLLELDEKVRQSSPGILTSLLMPSLTSCNRAAVRADAKRRVAQVGLAMHLYRVAKGTFPDKLNDLSPDFIPVLPRDPYDGKPLKLKTTDSGWTVYSIGPNVKDDAGHRRFDFADNVVQGDLTFEYVGQKQAEESKNE